MAVINLDALVIQIIVNIILLVPVLWITGRLLVGKEKAKFTDALWIVILGTLISAAFQYLLGSGIIASIILLIILLGLVKQFFDCGWLKALAIAIVAILMWIVIAIIVGIILGLAIIGGSFLF
jgi:hypothetical protein